jgi:type IV pilus assembly protein PilV
MRVNRPSALPLTRARGVALLEVLVTIVILTIGLLGSAGLQSRLQVAEVEAYQRAQAIVLLQDMVDRINANRKNAASYVTAAPLGVGSTLDCTAPATVALEDQCAWSSLLQGAAETTGGGATKLGAMNGARGCISNPVTSMPRELVVAVVWQGLVPTGAPASTDCGEDLYGDEKNRRALIARVKIGCLQNDPTTGVCVTP